MSQNPQITTRIIKLRVHPVGPISIHPQSSGLTPSVITVRNEVLMPSRNPGHHEQEPAGQPQNPEAAALQPLRQGA